MKLLKFTLGFVLIFNAIFTNAQWDIKVPNIDDTKNKLLADKALIKEIETQMGLPFSQLKFESDGWVGEEGSPFSLSYSDCGEKMYPAWPKDGCYTKFIVSGPKDKDGVYKIMGVYADYSRSSFNGEECKLYNQWTYKGYRTESAQEYGYKEFTVDEAKSLLMDYLNSGEAHALDNFIEITSIDFENFGQSSSNAGMHHLNYFFQGNEAIFTDDRTSIIGIRDPGTLRMTLQVEKDGDKWVGKKLGLRTGQMYLYDQSYNPELTTVYETKMYANYKDDGIKSIYPKRTEKTKVDGELEALMKRINDLYTIMETKKNDLVFTDIQDFFAPEDVAFAEEWFITNFTESPKRYIVLSHNLNNVLPYKYTENDHTQKIAFPELQAKTEKYNRPKKKYILETSCRDCQKRSSSDGGTTYHPTVWIFKKGNWYLMDAQSAFLMRDIKIDLRE